MGDLTENLSRSEFKSSDGKEIAVDFELVNAIQDCCDFLERITSRPVGVQITSPYRSPEVNAKTPNASETSYHLFGRAADHRYYFKDTGKRIKPIIYYTYLDKKYPDKFGVSLYYNRVHLDTRRNKWRDPQVKR